MTQALAKAVRAQADALTTRSYELQEEIPSDLHRLNKDVAELAIVLARVLEGKPILRAFGAPGDWGYGTPMGEAVRVALVGPEGSTASAVTPATTTSRCMFCGDWLGEHDKDCIKARRSLT